jgi:hypothetical protein
MGLQVPKDERARLEKTIADIGFVAHDETANPAYRQFLKN